MQDVVWKFKKMEIWNEQYCKWRGHSNHNLAFFQNTFSEILFDPGGIKTLSTRWWVIATNGG